MVEQNIVENQNIPIQPEPEKNNANMYAIFIGLFLILAIPMYAFLFLTRVKPTQNSIPLTMDQKNFALSPSPTPVLIPTITPVLITHKQDIDNALKLIDGVDTTNVEQTINQNSTDASSFGQ